MQLIRQSGRWVVLSTYAERFLVPRQENGRSYYQWNHQSAPGKWSTDRARVAAMLAEFADDETRADIQRLAGKEVDVDVPTLVHDGATYRYYSPYQMREAAQSAGFEFTREPGPAHWHTQDPDRAVKCYQLAQHYEGFTCPSAIQMVLQAHLEAQQAHIESSRVAGLDVEIRGPEGFDYRPFQKAAITYSLQRRNVLLGDEPGLGKTIEALGIINALRLRSVLVVCPASLKRNWLLEAERWLVDGQRVGIADSKQVPFGAETVIVNYESLGHRPVVDECLGCKHSKIVHSGVGIFPCRGQGEGMRCGCVQWVPPEKSEPVLREELNREWDMLIVDEAHKIKSPSAIRSRLTFSIRAKRMAFLTGTPIPNKTRELWTLVSHLAPESFPREWEFYRRFCGASKSNGWSKDGASNLSELQDKLRATIMCRRLKSEVMSELPPKQRQVIEFSAGALARFAHAEQDAWSRRETLRLELRTQVELSKASDDPEDYKSAVDALKQGMKVAFSEIAKLRHDTALAKVPLVVEHLRTCLEGGGKIVCFAHHKDVIAQVAAAFPGITVVLTGDTSLKDRDAAVRAFQTEDWARLFVGSIQAAGVGLTLTASAHVVFVELTYVPSDITQAEDRCHRIGAKGMSHV